MLIQFSTYFQLDAIQLDSDILRIVRDQAKNALNSLSVNNSIVLPILEDIF